MGDRIELQQVLLNLFLNACDAMSAIPPQARSLKVRTMVDPDGGVRVSVIDRGSGIPPDSVHRVFQPFFTSKAQGLGLGLSICRRIVIEHEGRIWVDHHLGEGATVSFSLPAHQEAAGSDAAGVGPREEPAPVA